MRSRLIVRHARSAFVDEEAVPIGSQLVCILADDLIAPQRPGANSFVFNGKIGGHKLAPGAYQLTATPAGGAPKTATFQMIA
jgi:hypothetical protein